MTENTKKNEELVDAADTEADDVEGHYLPLNDEGTVDFPAHVVGTEDDVEGHGDFDLDIERRR